MDMDCRRRSVWESGGLVGVGVLIVSILISTVQSKGQRLRRLCYIIFWKNILFYVAEE
jgi:hypothetical protein